MKFKDRLQKAMEHAKMTNSELAKNLGCSRALITYYIQGQYNPKPDMIDKLAECLGVNSKWLAGYETPMLDSNIDKITRIQNKILELTDSELDRLEELIKLMFGV